MTLGEMIKRYREEHSMSMDAFSKQSGISKAYISLLEKNRHPSTGKPIAPSLETIKQAAEGMGKDIDEVFAELDPDLNIKLRERTVPSLRNASAVEVQRVPLLGEIACGKPIIANQTFDAYVEVGAQIKCDFCLRAKGDSMIDARIHDGDVVFIKKQPEVENGEIAAVEIDGEATLKRFYAYENKIVLQAANPNYAPLIYVGNEIGEIHILGKAVAFQSDIK